MGFRITTNMMMNSYRYNLQNNTQKLADSRDMVLTHRNFNSYAEDPASATRAFRLRRSYTRTVNQLNNAKDCYGKFNTAWNNLGEIITNLQNPLAKVSSITGTNGTAGESRSALAQVLRETADSVVHSMNAQLGEQFVFAGVDGMNVPFTWSEDGTQLYFRGVNVNAGDVERPDAAVLQAPDWLDKAKNDGQAAGTWSDNDEAWYQYYSGNPDSKIPDFTQQPKWAEEMMGKTAATDEEKAWLNYYKDRNDMAKLKSMSSEERYIDLGMGAKENAPNDPILGSYFNDALVGINFLGYGQDESDGFGDPKNYAIMLKELADVFDDWRESGQMYLPPEYQDMTADELKTAMQDEDVEKYIKDYHKQQEDKAFRMIDKLKAGQEKFTESYVEMDARSKFLQTTQDRLSTQQLNINEQFLDIEQVDLAEAIINFSWDMYCYNAALKIGNQLLSQSLIDYMN